MVASIVPKDLLQNATTWNQGIWLSASVIGHASVGFFIAGFGNTGSLITIASLVAVGFSFMWRIKPKPPLKERGEQKTLESVKEGLSFVFRTKEVLGALSLGFVCRTIWWCGCHDSCFCKRHFENGTSRFWLAQCRI